MSEKWETVVAPKRKPKSLAQSQSPKSNGVPKVPIPGAFGAKPQKPRKHSAKVPASFPLVDDDSDSIPDTVHGGGDGDKKAQAKKSESKTQGKKKAGAGTGGGPGGDNKPKEKRRDLPSTLTNFKTDDLLLFFKQLQNAGTAEDVCLSWIKYSADALNTKLNQSQFIPPDASQWPNDLNFPPMPGSLVEVIKTIVSETSAARTNVDVLGISFSSLLASIPTVIQRGDPGWGYLLFLRELCRIDPSLPIRREKSFWELMESYGNRKEIGLPLLYSVAQAGVDSPYMLKIASQYILPYYGFKHYKQFVLAALSTISSTTSSSMAVEYLIEGDEFEEFFEAAFDVKKKRDLEKIYPRVKELVLKGLKNQGSTIFLKFLEKAGDKDFSPLSPYGKEVFNILLGCIENDPACIDTWRDNLSTFPKESAAFFSYLSKVPESMKLCGDRLETKLIQSDEFAVAAVKNPELLRTAKKVQVGLERVALSKRKIFSWKMAIFILMLIIGGMFYLDVTENGKGSFEKSNTGKFLEKYGVLKEAVLVVDAVTNMLKYVREYATVLFRSIYEGVRPVLQSIGAKIQQYIPQLTEYLTIIGNFMADSFMKFVNFLQTNVFVGALSPENLRRLTKDALTFTWTYILAAFDKVYSLIEKYVS